MKYMKKIYLGKDRNAVIDILWYYTKTLQKVAS